MIQLDSDLCVGSEWSSRETAAEIKEATKPARSNSRSFISNMNVISSQMVFLSPSERRMNGFVLSFDWDSFSIALLSLFRWWKWITRHMTWHNRARGRPVVCSRSSDRLAMKWQDMPSARITNVITVTCWSADKLAMRRCRTKAIPEISPGIQVLLQFAEGGKISFHAVWFGSSH
jgi:hypothetical protein